MCETKDPINEGAEGCHTDQQGVSGRDAPGSQCVNAETAEPARFGHVMSTSYAESVEVGEDASARPEEAHLHQFNKQPTKREM